MPLARTRSDTRTGTAARRVSHGFLWILALTVVVAGQRGGAALAAACSVTGFTGAYGTVDILADTAIDTTATFTVTCSGAAANEQYRFCLNIGPGSTATGPSGQRVMRSTGDYLDHELYFNSARTQLWGSWGIGVNSAYPSGSAAGIQTDVTMNGSGAGTFTYTVYGRILANQTDTKPGNFTWTGTGPTVQYRPRSGSGSSNCPNNGGSADGGTMSFTATVSAACKVSATSMNFGSSGSTTSNIDSTSSITVQCTNTTPYTVGLGAGNGSGATVSVRKMTSGTNSANYSLYSDNARSTVWGNTSGQTIGGTGSGSNQAYTVYGRVPIQASPPSGTYSDSIVVTITY